MVTKILQSEKNVFWEALVITIFIFGIGILLGVFIENGRSSKLSDFYIKSETNLLDLRAQMEIIDLEEFNCGKAIEENIKFGDRIYEDAKIAERFEGASRIKDSSLTEQHRRYDALRTLFWINSIKIKKKCENPFSTVVYVYDYDTEDLMEKTRQKTISNFLSQLKQEQADKIVLIPIAKNLGLSSLNILLAELGVNKTAVIINEEEKFYEIQNLSEIEKFLI